MELQLKRAMQAYQAGDLGVARRRCVEMLRRTPNHPVALHLMGGLCLQQGQAAEALIHLQAAAAVDPDNAQLHADLGFAALRSEQFDTAVGALRRAFALGDKTADVQCWLGMALSCAGDHLSAVDAFAQAAKLRPDDSGLYLNLGNALRETGSIDEALSAFHTALRLNPRDAAIHNGLGAALLAAARPGESVAALERALELEPGYVEAHNNLGNALLALGEEARAEQQFRRALDLRSDFPAARRNLGNLLRSRGDLVQAVEQYAATLAIDPGDHTARVNLGGALLDLGRVAEARAHIEQAVAQNPGDPGARTALGMLRHDEGRLDEEIGEYRAVGAAAADSPDLEYNLALALMYRREFAEAFDRYDARVATAAWRSRIREANRGTIDLLDRLPRWTGPDHRGCVAVLAEQGLGDEILFATLIPELVRAGVSFVYELDRRLVPLFERACPDGRFVPLTNPPAAELASASSAVLAGSLPRHFRRSRECFSRQPAKLLQEDVARAASYRSRLDAVSSGIKIALSWRSSRADRVTPKKSTTLAALAPLLRVPGVQFVDVQYGDTAEERAAIASSVGAELMRFEEVDHHDDLDGVIAILAACDLVVTTSNVTAHLAGAIGRRTWVLYPGTLPPFHYWTCEPGDEHSLWYPSVSVLHADAGDWTELAALAAAKLKDELS